MTYAGVKRHQGGRSVATLALAVVLVACGATHPGRSTAAGPGPRFPFVTAGPAGPGPTAPPVTLPVPAAVTDPGLGLRSAAVATPLELIIPALKVKAPVLAVGITPTNVMAAPEGPPSDPVWQDAFWYRGGSMPGAVGTATIAGHVDDSVGRFDVFGHLQDLRTGDAIVIRDQRSGLAVIFSVTETDTYTLAQAADPAVLTRLYGDGPVRGVGPQPSADGLAHLTLITCAGTFDTSEGTHDHRLVVYATRVS